MSNKLHLKDDHPYYNVYSSYEALNIHLSFHAKYLFSEQCNTTHHMLLLSGCFWICNLSVFAFLLDINSLPPSISVSPTVIPCRDPVSAMRKIFKPGFGSIRHRWPSTMPVSRNWPQRCAWKSSSRHCWPAAGSSRPRPKPGRPVRTSALR